MSPEPASALVIGCYQYTSWIAPYSLMAGRVDLTVIDIVLIKYYSIADEDAYKGPGR